MLRHASLRVGATGAPRMFLLRIGEARYERSLQLPHREARVDRPEVSDEEIV